MAYLNTMKPNTPTKTYSCPKLKWLSNGTKVRTAHANIAGERHVFKIIREIELSSRGSFRYQLTHACPAYWTGVELGRNLMRPEAEKLAQQQVDEIWLKMCEMFPNLKADLSTP